jgi:hypothetical protein
MPGGTPWGQAQLRIFDRKFLPALKLTKLVFSNPAQISLKHSSQLTNKTTLATTFVFIRHVFHCVLHVCLCFHIVGKTG